MKKITVLFSFLGLSLASLLLSSCGCCTAEEGAPALRPEPSFSTFSAEKSSKDAPYIDPSK